MSGHPDAAGGAHTPDSMSLEDSTNARARRGLSQAAWRELVDLQLEEGRRTMEQLASDLQRNTELTAKIAANTAGIVALSTELQAGTRFLCRCALGVSWLMKTAKDYWPVLGMILLTCAYISNSTKLLEFATRFFKLG